MRLKTIILLFFISIFILVWIATIFFTGPDIKVTLNIAGNSVNEEISYSPNKNYHTIYRYFVDPISFNQYPNSINIREVKCSSGQAYIFARGSTCYSGNLAKITCPPNTKENEYGCTFGDSYGFSKSKTYILSAAYDLNPSNIYNVKEKNYIKFVVYSPYEHNLMIRNLKIDSKVKIIRKFLYLPNENVIVYIPYEGSIEDKEIEYLKNFKYDSSLLHLITFFPKLLFWILLIIFVIIFGKGKSLDSYNVTSHSGAAVGGIGGGGVGGR